jgi:hypothetical protein
MEWECPSCGRQHATVPDRCSQCGEVPEIVLNRWRCQHCGQEDIPGTQDQCPTCKAQKAIGVDVRVDTGARVDGARGLALAREAWPYCAFCDVQVPPVDEQGAKRTQCPNCGGGLSEAKKEAAVQTLSAGEAGTYRKEQVQARGAAPAPQPKPPPKKSHAGMVVLVVVAALALGAYLIFFHRWKKELTVSDRQWQRTVEVETFGPVNEEAWQNEVPAAAYRQSCQRKVHHVDKVPDGTETYTARESAGRECTSYNYKTQGGVSVKQCANWETKYREVQKTRTRYRDVPVWRQHCRFTVDKWHRDRDVVAKGSGNDKPEWPKLAGVAGKERPGKRVETYSLTLRKPDGQTVPHKCESEAEWNGFALNAAVVAEVTTTGSIKKLTIKK